jgi:hypothetical protein
MKIFKTNKLPQKAIRHDAMISINKTSIMRGRGIRTKLAKFRQHSRRITYVFTAVVMLASVAATPTFLDWLSGRRYALSPHHLELVGEVKPALRAKLTYDQKEDTYRFNAEAQMPDENTDPSQMTPEQLKAIVGSDEKRSQLYSLDLPRDGKQGVTFHDTNLKLSFRMKPKFEVGPGREVDGRLVYPMKGAKAVYTTKGNGLKEDILFDKAPAGGEAAFVYDLELPKELEARLNEDGSVGVYSADPALFGNISYGNDEDQLKVQNARETADKNHLVFHIPAPIIITASGDTAESQTWFNLEGNQLTVKARNLDTIKEPFSLDPTVVVTSSSDFMTGNEEDNIHFGTDEIRRSTISAGMIESWTTTSSTTTAKSSHGAAVYNGYMYAVGGYDDTLTNPIATVEYAPINSDWTVGTWQTTTQLPAERRRTTTVAYNGYLYAIGGVDASNFNRDTVYYAPINTNGTLGSWSTTTQMPTTLSAHTGFAYNGYMYVLGGWDGSGRTDAVRYAPINANGTLGSWSSTTSLPLGRDYHSTAVYNGYVYVGGGRDPSGNYLGDLHFATLNKNGTIGSWTATTSLTQTLFQGTSVAKSGYFYVIGGLQGATPTRTGSVRYAPIMADGSIGTFTLSNQSLSPVVDLNAAVAYGDYIYHIGGRDTNTTAMTAVKYAKIKPLGTTNTYTTTTAPPTYSYSCGVLCTTTNSNIAHHATVAHNGYIYLVGGMREDNTAANTVYYAPLNTNGTIGTWTATSSLGTARYDHAAVVFGGRLYVLGGWNGTSNFASVERATINSDGTLGSWATTTSFSTARRGHTAVAHDSRMYVAGGTNGTTTYNTVQHAVINSTGTIGSWTTTTSMPEARRDHAMVAYGEYMYIFGGSTTAAGNFIDTVAYAPFNSDGTLGTWVNGPSLPAVRGEHGIAIAKGNVYITGGVASGTTGTNTVYYAALNPSGGVAEWSASQVNLPTARRSHASVGYDGYIYSIAGMNGTTLLGDSRVASIIDRSTGALGSWSTTNGLQTGRWDHTAAVYRGYMYAIGGGGTTTYHSSVEYASINLDGTVSSWSFTTSLNEARRNHSSVVYGGHIYVFGGTGTGGVQLSSIEYAPINSDGTLGTWTVLGNLTSTRSSHTSVVHRGYVYIIGGLVGGTRQSLVEMASISNTGSISEWRSTTSLPAARNGHASVVAGSYLYVIGSDGTGAASDSVQYAYIGADGTLSAWRDAANLSSGRYDHGAYSYGGYIYILGGFVSSTRTATGEYAHINSDGSLGRWTATTNLETSRSDHPTVAYRGYIYNLAGLGVTGNTTVNRASIDVIHRAGQYSKLVDLGSVTNLTDITFSGAPQVDKRHVYYRLAGSTGVFGAVTSATALTGYCSAVSVRYVLVIFAFEDAEAAVYGDTHTQSAIQDFTASYGGNATSGVPPDRRLARGKYFNDASRLQPLDTLKVSNVGGC